MAKILSNSCYIISVFQYIHWNNCSRCIIKLPSLFHEHFTHLSYYFNLYLVTFNNILSNYYKSLIHQVIYIESWRSPTASLWFELVLTGAWSKGIRVFLFLKSFTKLGEKCVTLILIFITKFNTISSSAVPVYALGNISFSA